MAASITTPPMKKPTTAFRPRRNVKAQIFGEIAETVASAASRACYSLGIIKKDDNGSAPAPATPPETTATYGG